VRLAALAILLLHASAAAAAELTVSATLNSARAFVGDQLVLSVSIAGSGSASPRVPPIPDVEIYESGKSQSMSIVNGAVSSRVVYTYVLNPQKAGRYVLPPVEVAGAAPTAPIAFVIEAVPADPLQAAPPPAQAPSAPAGAPPPQRPSAGPAPDAFVTATLDKGKAFVNEQVTLTVRFFTAVPLLGAPQYDAPKLTGLLAENLGAEGQGTTVIGGRSYNYSELKSALFPVQAGRATVGPAVVTVQIPRRGAIGSGDDFFDRFFNAAAPEARRLQTDPLALQAEPLPPGVPEDFSGVVGALTVEASADRTQAKTGEAVNLTVVVSGVGNIKSLPEPKRPDLPSVRFFDSESSVKLERIGEKVGGSKTFKTVIVARVSGPLEIPPFSVSYYDPAKRAYARAQSKPVRLSVLPGDPNAALPLVGGGSTPAPGVTEVAADIRYLKGPTGSSALADALAGFGRRGPWHAAPGVFLLAALAVVLRRRALAADPRARRSRFARETAEGRLKQAEAQPEAERARATALLGEAFTGYFADKLDLAAASLTLKAITQRLQARKTPPPAASLDGVRNVWNELDQLRYAPGGADRAEIRRIAAEIRELMQAFDKEPR